ncbi:hypothetical protein D3C71_1395320 [compost metagenome]
MFNRPEKCAHFGAFSDQFTITLLFLGFMKLHDDLTFRMLFQYTFVGILDSLDHGLDDLAPELAIFVHQQQHATSGYGYYMNVIDRFYMCTDGVSGKTGHFPEELAFREYSQFYLYFRTNKYLYLTGYQNINPLADLALLHDKLAGFIMLFLHFWS